MKRFRRILYPTDFSNAAGPAFTQALQLAKQNRAELLLVHVLLRPAAYVGDGYLPSKTYEALDAEARQSAKRRLSTLLTRAREAEVRAKAFLLDGVPADQIARAARSKRADLIVMGTHGRTGPSRFFMGSVAARVIPLALPGSLRPRKVAVTGWRTPSSGRIGDDLARERGGARTGVWSPQRGRVSPEPSPELAGPPADTDVWNPVFFTTSSPGPGSHEGWQNFCSLLVQRH